VEDEMRRFSVAEALLIVGTVVFVVVAFLVLELQRTQQLRMEYLLAAQAAAHDSPPQVNMAPQPLPPSAPQVAVVPEPPAPQRAHPRPVPRAHSVDPLDPAGCEGSNDPLCGLH
jgi:hypothetical protein